MPAVRLCCQNPLRQHRYERLEANMAAESIAPMETYERLLRYGVAIDREFYRSAHELERLQRIRQGIGVPSPVVADIDIGRAPSS